MFASRTIASNCCMPVRHIGREYTASMSRPQALMFEAGPHQIFAASFAEIPQWVQLVAMHRSTQVIYRPIGLEIGIHDGLDHLLGILENRWRGENAHPARHGI